MAVKNLIVFVNGDGLILKPLYHLDAYKLDLQ